MDLKYIKAEKKMMNRFEVPFLPEMIDDAVEVDISQTPERKGKIKDEVDRRSLPPVQHLSEDDDEMPHEAVRV